MQIVEGQRSAMMQWYVRVLRRRIIKVSVIIMPGESISCTCITTSRRGSSPFIRLSSSEMLSQRDRMGTRTFLCHLNFTNLHIFIFSFFPSWDPVRPTRVLSSNSWEHVEMRQWRRRSENENIHSDDFSLISGKNRCKSCGPVIYFFIKYDARDIDSSVWTAGYWLVTFGFADSR